MIKIYILFISGVFLSISLSAQNTFPASGNVGIGTISPRRTLDLTAGGEITFGDDVARNSTSGIYWYVGNHYGVYRTSGEWTSNSYQQLRIQFDTGIQLAPGPDLNTGYDRSFVEIVTGKGLMVSSGTVGIGTTDTKGYKLAVNGNAIAESMTVKLQSQWPDYVFKPAYRLPSLKFIRNYVVKNGRLPEMPSEKEVADSGVNLGEMVKMQTKKIEELTLYLIEKDKQLAEQGKKMKAQDLRLKELEKSMKRMAKSQD